MATDQMYELAFQYKKTKLWKKLYDTQVFAIRLPDGETGYCSVMGMLGEHISLAVYVGKVGFHSFRQLAFQDSWDPMDKDDTMLLFAQDCLQCSFESREFMREEALEDARRYAKAHKITLRGANAFPQFSQFVPNRYPWTYETELDNQRICEALSAGIALAKMLEGGRSARSLGLYELQEDTDAIPLLERDGTAFRITAVSVPPEPEESELYPVPGPMDQATVEKLCGLKKKGILECGIFHLPEPVQDSAGGAPWFPAMMLCVQSRNGMVLPILPAVKYEQRPDLLRENLFEMLIENKFCPQAVRVADGEARAVLEEFCSRCGVLLTMDANLPGYLSARDSFLKFSYPDDDDDEDEMDFDFFGEDDEDDDDSTENNFQEMIGQLMELSDAELKTLPRSLAAMMVNMPEMGVPAPLVQRLRRLFHL